MSTVMVVAPVIIANWPAITAAVTAAMSVTGFTAVQHASGVLRQTNTTSTRQTATIDVEDSEVLNQANVVNEQIVMERDGVLATFKRDPNGALQLCVEGDHLSKAELRALGEELIGRVTQAYAYNRIVTELSNRGMTIINEEKTENQSVKIRVRNY